ncbi:hypothetical protein RISK_000178 [Rhodopirellula islandica]|uniref:Uncharacterized protein n=1 Tax=Rhodopirellula islandica TaxID=595434 RepID=A0A0J1BMT8_RHOIS|nr:hypothetical protein RISK_000178 [Rhodopirellula islandica]
MRHTANIVTCCSRLAKRSIDGLAIIESHEITTRMRERGTTSFLSFTGWLIPQTTTMQNPPSHAHLSTKQ